jgi:hypothetical protein
VFAQVRRELSRQRKIVVAPLREAVTDFYGEEYLRPTALGSPVRLIDLRRNERLSVVVIPECFDNGTPTPCAYIRLLQPLDHPEIGHDFDVVLADAEEALRYRADIFMTQRYAVPDVEAADRLIRHCRQHDIPLLYDLDDDLLHVPATIRMRRTCARRRD